MDAVLAIIDVIGQLIPPKQDRARRWHRVGCLVALSFGAIAGIFVGLYFIAGGG